VTKAYLVGASADEFSGQMGALNYEKSGTIEAAVMSAVDDAADGDVVLLAPACASFDQFKSFEDRGDVFVATVKVALGE
jgi:UDP-N-acetylmuramoylalanine--D-glutamate ligase